MKKPSKVSDEILLTTHETSYLNLVKSSFPKKGFSSLDGDTIISPGSKEATFDAVGSIITAIDGVEKKNLEMHSVVFGLLDIIAHKVRQLVFVF